MQDQTQYTGATYNAEMYKLPTETMSEYLARLAKLRARGILGGGGMLDLKETPTVVTPAAQQPLGELVVRNTGGDSDYTPPVDTRTPEEKMRDAVAIQAGTKSDWGKVIASAIPVVGGMLGNYAAGKREDKMREVLQSQGIDDARIDEYLTNPDYNKELVNAYNKGQFTGGNVPSELLDPSEAGSAVVYGVENLPDTFMKAVGLRDRVENPFMTKVLGNPDYGTFTNFLAQQTPMTRTPSATSVDADIVGGMFSNEIGNRIVNTYTDSDTGTSYTVAGNSDYTDGSWDTSGGGTNPDGSYDISSWY